MTHAPASSSAKSYKHQWVAFAVMVLILAVAPIWVYPVFLMKVMCFALFACAFNLLLGFGGLLSFGHAMFLGSAGYVSAHAAKVWGLNPEFCVLLGTGTSALLALVVGQLAIRRQGIYFAMITLALAQMVFFICLQAPFTGGEDGLQGVPRGALLGLLPLDDDLTLYYVVLAFFVACFLAIGRIVTSPCDCGSAAPETMLCITAAVMKPKTFRPITAYIIQPSVAAPHSA